MTPAIIAQWVRQRGTPAHLSARLATTAPRGRLPPLHALWELSPTIKDWPMCLSVQTARLVSLLTSSVSELASSSSQIIELLHIPFFLTSTLACVKR